MNQHTRDALMRLPAVLEVVPLSRSGWLAGVKAGKFPAPVRLSERVVAWRASDIQALIDGAGQARQKA